MSNTESCEEQLLQCTGETGETGELTEEIETEPCEKPEVKPLPFAAKMLDPIEDGLVLFLAATYRQDPGMFPAWPIYMAPENGPYVAASVPPAMPEAVMNQVKWQFAMWLNFIPLRKVIWVVDTALQHNEAVSQLWIFKYVAGAGLQIGIFPYTAGEPVCIEIEWLSQEQMLATQFTGLFETVIALDGMVKKQEAKLAAMAQA